MGTRPLRQYHGEGVPMAVEDTLAAPLADAWRRHRHRLLDELEALDAAAWATTTRCDAWDVTDVVNHLATADGFWVASIAAAAAGAPSSYLVGFDPTAVPAAIVAPMRARGPAAALDALLASTEAFVAAVDALGDARSVAWSAVGELPFGHVPLSLVLAHAHWDSWLHERDVLVPLGEDPPIEADELAAATWYALLAAGVQGGLLDDPAPVGPGVDGPIDVTLAFDDLPAPLHLRVDRTARVGAGRPTDAAAAGSALALVETFTGRATDALDPGVPSSLADHLHRARQIL